MLNSSKWRNQDLNTVQFKYSTIKHSPILPHYNTLLILTGKLFKILSSSSPFRLNLECLHFTLQSWILLLQKYDSVTQAGISLACPGIWKCVLLDQNGLKKVDNQHKQRKCKFFFWIKTYTFTIKSDLFFQTFYLRAFSLK